MELFVLRQYVPRRNWAETGPWGLEIFRLGLLDVLIPLLMHAFMQAEASHFDHIQVVVAEQGAPFATSKP